MGKNNKNGETPAPEENTIWEWSTEDRCTPKEFGPYRIKKSHPIDNSKMSSGAKMFSGGGYLSLLAAKNIIVCGVREWMVPPALTGSFGM